MKTATNWGDYLFLMNGQGSTINEYSDSGMSGQMMTTICRDGLFITDE
jgi:hypothetical protein